MPTTLSISDYASEDDAARAVTSRPGFNKLPAVAQQAALTHTRELWTSFQESKNKPAPTSIEPAKPKAGEAPAPAPDNKDFMGKVAEKAESGVAALEKKTGIPDPIGELAAKALPHSNAQAFIDSLVIGQMMVAPELELGWMTESALAAAAGATGGAIQGGKEGAIEGAAMGAGEVMGGRVAGAAVRGGANIAAGGLLPKTAGNMAGKFTSRSALDRANAKGSGEDIGMISNWLDERFPTLKGRLKTMEDWKELFHRGGLLKETTDNLNQVNANTARAINSTVKKAEAKAPATVFTLKEQDVAQDEALASVRGGDQEHMTDREIKARDRGATVTGEDAIPPTKGSETRGPSKGTVFSKRADPQEAYDKVKSIQAELKAAKARKGSGLTAENKAREEQVAEIRSRLKTAQEDARAATKGTKAPGHSYLRDVEDAAAARRQAPGYVFKAPGSTPRPITDPKEPLIQVFGIPDTVADEMGIRNREKVGVPFDVAKQALKRVEDDGWALSNSVGHAQQAVAARSSAIQIENSMVQGLAKINPEAAAKWQAARVQQRAARALTYLLSAPGVTNEKGNIAMDVLMESAQSRKVFMDLEASLGPDEAQSFVKMIGRGQTAKADVPGKPFTVWGRVHAVGGVIPVPSFGFHFGQAPIRVGNAALPYDLGPNKALAMVLTLGPARFVQTLGDIVDWNNLPENQAIRRAKAIPAH